MLKKKRFDLRTQFAKPDPEANPSETDQKKEEADLDHEISVLECASKDLI